MRNLFALIASVLFILPAFATIEIIGGDHRQPVTLDERAVYPLSVVDVRTGQKWEITTEQIQYRKETAIVGEDIGRIKLHLNPGEYSTDSLRTISTWAHYDGQMAFEALQSLASLHTVTLFLAQPSVANTEWSINYATFDVKVQVDSNKLVYLYEVLSTYKKQQEREFGRYYGIGGVIRKTARRLTGQNVKICASLFEAR